MEFIALINNSTFRAKFGFVCHIKQINSRVNLFKAGNKFLIVKHYKPNDFKIVIFDFERKLMTCFENTLPPLLSITHNNNNNNNKIISVIYGYKENKSLPSPYSIGKELGKFHRELENHSLYKLSPKIRIKYENLDNFIISDFNYINLLQKKLLDLKLDLIKKYNSIFIERFNKIPQQLIHGDMRVENIISNSDRIYFIDLDQMSVFFKSYDLIRFSFLNYLNYKKDLTSFNNFWLGYFSSNQIMHVEKIDMFKIFFITQILDDVGIFKGLDNSNVTFIEYKYNLLLKLDKNFKYFNNLFLKL